MFRIVGNFTLDAIRYNKPRNCLRKYRQANCSFSRVEEDTT